MSNLVTNAGHTHVDGHGHDDHHHDSGEMTVYGFWLYLMTDCILFASIFAVYAAPVVGPDGAPGWNRFSRFHVITRNTAPPSRCITRMPEGGGDLSRNTGAAQQAFGSTNRTLHLK